MERIKKRGHPEGDDLQLMFALMIYASDACIHRSPLPITQIQIAILRSKVRGGDLRLLYCLKSPVFIGSKATTWKCQEIGLGEVLSATTTLVHHLGSAPDMGPTHTWLAGPSWPVSPTTGLRESSSQVGLAAGDHELFFEGGQPLKGP